MLTGIYLYYWYFTPFLIAVILLILAKKLPMKEDQWIWTSRSSIFLAVAFYLIWSSSNWPIGKLYLFNVTTFGMALGAILGFLISFVYRRFKKLREDRPLFDRKIKPLNFIFLILASFLLVCTSLIYAYDSRLVNKINYDSTSEEIQKHYDNYFVKHNTLFLMFLAPYPQTPDEILEELNP